MTPLLEVRDLVTGFGATRVVDGVSFRIAAGETYALLRRIRLRQIDDRTVVDAPAARRWSCCVGQRAAW